MKPRDPIAEALDALEWLLRRAGVDTDYPVPNEDEPLCDYIVRIMDQRLEAAAEQTRNEVDGE